MIVVKIVFADAWGGQKEVDAKPGISLMAAAIAEQVPGIEATCGGSMSCGTCHAYIDAAAHQIPAPSDAEAAMIECGLDVRATSRLTCQIVVTAQMEGMVVTTPEAQT